MTDAPSYNTWFVMQNCCREKLESSSGSVGGVEKPSLWHTSLEHWVRDVFGWFETFLNEHVTC